MSQTIQIAAFPDPQFGENGYVVWRADGGPSWIVDPGFRPAPQQMLALVQERRLRPEKLILTHGHLDHIAGVHDIREALPDIPVYIAEAARPALTDPNENLSAGYGIPIVVGDIPTHDLPDGGTLELDGLTWTLLDVSGHAPGSRCLYCPEAGVVIVGDALFSGSVGRTDFHHSDPAAYFRNIREKLLTLPDETRVLPGHGPATTIGEERATNPFVGEGASLPFD